MCYPVRTSANVLLSAILKVSIYLHILSSVLPKKNLVGKVASADNISWKKNENPIKNTGTAWWGKQRDAKKWRHWPPDLDDVTIATYFCWARMLYYITQVSHGKFWELWQMWLSCAGQSYFEDLLGWHDMSVIFLNSYSNSSWALQELQDCQPCFARSYGRLILPNNPAFCQVQLCKQPTKQFICHDLVQGLIFLSLLSVSSLYYYHPEHSGMFYHTSTAWCSFQTSPVWHRMM